MMKKKGMERFVGSVRGLVIMFFLLAGIALQGQAAEVTEEKLSLKTGDGLTLSAMLDKPVGEGPFPAVMINHGSDGQREEWGNLGSKAGGKGVCGPGFELPRLFGVRWEGNLRQEGS